MAPSLFFRRIGALAALVLLSLSIGGVETRSAAQTGDPTITGVTIVRRTNGTFQAVVTGTGFSSLSEVDVNGTPSARTRPGATGPRVRDPRLEDIAAGNQGVFRVLDRTTGRTSPPFLVNPNASPVITAATLPALQTGTTTNVTIEGRNLIGAQPRISGEGITVVPGDSLDPRRLPLAITVAPNVPTGTRTLTVGHAGGVSEPLALTVGGNAAASVRLSEFARIPNGQHLYHMTETPDGGYAATLYGLRSVVFLGPEGAVERTRGGFLLVPAMAFYSRDIAYTTCVPAPLGCWQIQNRDVVRYSPPPGSLGGVSVPRYLLGVDGLVSSTFFLSNGGTGEIRIVDPARRDVGRVIARGFTVASTDADTRGPEQLAYDRTTQTLFAVDSGQGTLVAVDVAAGTQQTLRSDLNQPFGLVRLPNGNLLISERATGRLVETTVQGRTVATYDTGQGRNALRGLFVDSRGRVFLLGDQAQAIFRVEFR